jgi:GT2 family glycosyltransferase
MCPQWMTNSMIVSLIIPVWNGAAVIRDCLRAIYAHSGEQLREVIAVDNASPDDSAQLIRDYFPQVTLLPQPVNLGFAGGVNAGMAAAQGEVFVLLNQDCLVQPDWLDAIEQALRDQPQIGLAGCTIFNADGSLNHAGAFIQRPLAVGAHITERVADVPQPVEYVTGAALVIRRSTWDAIGRFDEGFYPAYFEESDYCYRARRAGLDTWYIPGAHVTHVISSREWQHDPVKHTANHHQSRYRFVGKHFTSDEVLAFTAAELAALDAETYLDQAVARVIAARSILRALPDIVTRRRLDGLEQAASVPPLQLQVTFTQILRAAFARAQQMLHAPHGDRADVLSFTAEVRRRADALRRREIDLLARIYFIAPAEVQPEAAVHRLIRLLIKRPLSFISGREHLLLAELNTVHVMRQDVLLEEVRLLGAYQQLADQRVDLLKLLTDYDYR